jgi:peptidoglycan/xylan/chitin deacetylase (PgdA/CDA1 family)
MFRKIALTMIKYSGLPLLSRNIFQKNKVTIIYYHRIAADVFDKHLALLKKYFNIIPLQSYLNGEAKRIKNRLVITFDDGHVSNFNLLPVLKKYNVQITIFLSSGLIGSNKHFWFLTAGLTDDYKKIIKRINDEDRLKRLFEKFHFSDAKEYDHAQALNIEQINKMLDYVDFQSHTITHPCLPQCSDEKALKEIRYSKDYLEKLLNKKINCMAFPNNNYTEREIRMSLESGYKYLLTGISGFNSDDGKCFLLKRISTNDTGDLNELLLRVTGVWRLLKLFKQKDK